MSPPRKVPGIGRGPQSFSQSAKRPIQSPMMQPPMNPVQQAMASPFQTIGNIPAPAEPVYSVEQDIQDLAMEIYARLVVEHFRTRVSATPGIMQDLAEDSRIAARAFFEEQSSKEV